MYLSHHVGSVTTLGTNASEMPRGAFLGGTIQAQSQLQIKIHIQWSGQMCSGALDLNLYQPIKVIVCKWRRAITG